MRNGLRRAVGVSVMAVLCTACGQTTLSSRDAAHSPSIRRAVIRPALKATCADVRMRWPRALHVAMTNRVLVPFSGVLLGVETKYRGDNGIFVETRSGGYVDDITEPYDDLRVIQHQAVGTDPSAEVMRGLYKGDPVTLVMWRESLVAKPCDVHVLLVGGARAIDTQVLLRGLL